jgi:hypothetical protein
MPQTRLSSTCRPRRGLEVPRSQHVPVLRRLRGQAAVDPILEGVEAKNRAVPPRGG